MIKKLLVAMFLIMIALPSLAAVTVTWVTPPANSTYNNLPSNIRNIDLNFTVTDDNTSTNDLNVSLRVINESGWAVAQTIWSDSNMRATTGCSIGATGATASSNCTYSWTLPGQATMPDGTYYLDANVVDYYAEDGENLADANAMLQIVISTHITTAQATRDIMSIVGMVLAGIVLLGGLASVAILRTDVTKTAILTIVAAVAVAIGSMIIGIVLTAL